MNALELLWTHSIYYLFFLFVTICFFEIFSTTKIYFMLILNLKNTKHSQHIPLLGYHLNSDATMVLSILRKLEIISKLFMW